mmetsp:Transcript_10017/g.33221  ORF Transcript_10017/g.33221 Transcript_10017/m.33221 type:complete len:262 (+) Transcript_10017:479-1264(+)
MSLSPRGRSSTIGAATPSSGSMRRKAEAADTRTCKSARSRSCPASTSPQRSVWYCSATRAATHTSRALSRRRQSARARTNDLHDPVTESSAASVQSSAAARIRAAAAAAAGGCSTTRLEVAFSWTPSASASQDISGSYAAASLAASSGSSSASARSATTSVCIVRSIDDAICGRIDGTWSMDVVASFISGIVYGWRNLPCACHSIATAHAIASVGSSSGDFAGVCSARPSSVTAQRAACATRCTPTDLYHTLIRLCIERPR